MKVSQYETETLFDYTWKQVAIAYWNRYPNPSSSHVLTEDTISREVRDGKLYTRRLLSKTNPVPKWGERFFIKNTPVKILEDSVLDPKKRTLTTFTRNIGFKKIMKVDEIVEYSEDANGRTRVIKRAYVSSQVFGFSRAIRAFGIERFKINCNKAANGFNYVLRNMFPQQHHKHVAIEGTKGELATLATSTATATNQSQSKMEILKSAAKSSYSFIKNNTVKLAQIFSIKN